MTTTAPTEPDITAIEEFAQRTVQRFVDTATTLMVDLGHRTGLLEAAAKGPATSAELAQRSGLSERHVREWLGAVTCAGITTYDPQTGRYLLPPEAAAVLTGHHAGNLAAISPMLVCLAGFVDDVADRFRTGGGVAYERYRPGFTSAMDEINRRKYDALLLDEILPMAPGLLGRLEAGIRVGDLGCGTGHCLNLMAQRFPASTFVGYDLAPDALDGARAEATELGLANVRFEVRDVRQLPTDPSFGALFAFDAIHDQVDPDGVLRRAHDALADDGYFVALDINASSDIAENLANPLAPMLYAISVLHCMEVSLAGDGAALGTAWGRQLACSMLDAAGFADIDVHQVEQDPFNVVYTCRRY